MKSKLERVRAYWRGRCSEWMWRFEAMAARYEEVRAERDGMAKKLAEVESRYNDLQQFHKELGERAKGLRRELDERRAEEQRRTEEAMAGMSARQAGEYAFKNGAR